MNAEPAKSTSPLTRKTRQASDTRRGPARRERLDVDCLGEATESLDGVLRSRIIGQDEALDVITCAFSRVVANLRDPRRPALSLLLLGPTGVGKTETARAMAEALFGDESALTRIDCEEYSQGHEIAKLLGSPPGYVGYGSEPILSQRRLDQGHRRAITGRRGMLGEGVGLLGEVFPIAQNKCLSVVLFDEIEKASPVLWNSLLGILEGGLVTLGDGTTTDLTRSIVILTSNVGVREMDELLERNPIGFAASSAPEELAIDDLQTTALVAARETFPLEFLNRLDEKLVYGGLAPADLEAIFDKFLGELHDRAVHQAGFPLVVRVSPQARRRILTLGTSLRFGARPLRHAIDTELVAPLSRLIASRSVDPGDVVHVELRRRELVFYRKQAPPRTAVVARAAATAAARSGG